MTRFEDWPEWLIAYVDQRRDRPFEWVANDCCTFSFDGVKELTGADPMADWRGRYTCAFGVAKEMKRRGFNGLADAVSAAMPDMEIPPRLARRGDVVMFDVEEGPALGLSLGAVAAAAGPDGVIWVPLERWTKAWRVGGIV